MPFNPGKPRPQTYLVTEGRGYDREARLVTADDSADVPGRPATQHNGLPPSPKRYHHLRARLSAKKRALGPARPNHTQLSRKTRLHDNSVM
jgi:hypothetical protein